MVGPTGSLLGLGMAALYRMMAPVMFTLHDGETHSQCQSDEWFSVLSRRTAVFLRVTPPFHRHSSCRPTAAAAAAAFTSQRRGCCTIC